MAFSQVQLLALEEAIASGELVVKYDGMETTYRNSDDLMKTYRFVKEHLDTIKRNPTSVVSFS
ncbi:MAG: hypothetical protein KZQ83_14865 [gamma proteobacterium symbiont of Taylorina sp.]|nr:hypothetical protein [gamma proteobacterium symbiont of Taylorina sp.]